MDDLIDEKTLVETLEKEKDSYLIRNNGRYSFLTVEEDEHTFHARIDRNANTYDLDVPDSYDSDIRETEIIDLFEKDLDLNREF